MFEDGSNQWGGDLLRVRLKARTEEVVLFWLTYNPQWPEDPVWAEVSLENGRERIGVFWPPRNGIPFGVDGSASHSCFSIMAGAAETTARIRHGDNTWRIAADPVLDEIARSRWGASTHVRACFHINTVDLAPVARVVRVRVLDNQRTYVDRMFHLDDL